MRACTRAFRVEEAEDDDLEVVEEVEEVKEVEEVEEVEDAKFEEVGACEDDHDEFGDEVEDLEGDEI